jgi:hypothetical protein
LRHSVPAPENVRQVRGLELKLFHAELDGFDQIGRVDPVVFLHASTSVTSTSNRSPVAVFGLASQSFSISLRAFWWSRSVLMGLIVISDLFCLDFVVRRMVTNERALVHSSFEKSSIQGLRKRLYESGFSAAGEAV